MENRSHALMTGIFTIALLVAAVLVGLWLNRDRTERVPYEIATGQSLTGLNPQAAVRYRGLEVGRVEDIRFDPKVTGQILITLSIDTATPVTTTTFAMLGYQGVTGIALIQLDDDKTGSPLMPSSEKQPARIPLRPGLLDQLEKRGLAILDKAETLTTNLTNMTSPDNQQVIFGAFDNISKTAAAYGELPRRLGPTIDRLPGLTNKLDQLATSAGSMTRNYDQLATRLQAPNGPIDRLSTVIGSLEGATTNLELQTLPHLTSMADEASASLRAVRRTANSLSDRPQGILFGAPSQQPGPGEAGFVAPTK